MSWRLKKASFPNKKGRANTPLKVLGLGMLGLAGVSLFAGYTVWPDYMRQDPQYAYPEPQQLPSLVSGNQNANVNVRVNNSTLVTGQNQSSSAYRNNGCDADGCYNYDLYGGRYQDGEITVLVNQMAGADVTVYNVSGQYPSTSPYPMPTPQPAPTSTAYPQATATPAPSPTATQGASPTATAYPAATPTAAPYPTPTYDPCLCHDPTATPAHYPTATPTKTATPYPPATPTNTVVPYPTATPTRTATPYPAATYAAVAKGCSHGYWKNHIGSWIGYADTQRVSAVFSNASLYVAYGDTLMDALQYSGGAGASGGARILLRQAVAALLNAAHPGVHYPLTISQVISQVNAALATGNGAAMVSLAGRLDGYNNLGCPLN